MGLNYTKEADLQLAGCQNDVKTFAPAVLALLAPANTSRTITDDSVPAPTTESMRAELQAAANRPEKMLFIWYSGHGLLSGASDAAIVPLDFRRGGRPILDSDLHTLLFNAPGAASKTIVVAFDCCHSGSMLREQYHYSVTTDDLILSSSSGTTFYSNPAPPSAPAAGRAEDDLAPPPVRPPFRRQDEDEEDREEDSGHYGVGLMGDDSSPYASRPWEGERDVKRSGRAPQVESTVHLYDEKHAIVAKRDVSRSSFRSPTSAIIAIGACQESQTDADQCVDGKNCGALSEAIHHVVTAANGNLTWAQLLVGVFSRFRQNGLTQVPALESSIAIDVHTKIEL
jgi:Caspase domain